jgi:aryl-alcohol dehydrogenase-like predicted oxidoreductase
MCAPTLAIRREKNLNERDKFQFDPPMEDIMIGKKPFGKTGHNSTRVVFGAAALGSVSQEDADRTLLVLQKYGINHFDVAASYGKGEAEKRIGPWMKSIRNDIFLATKTGMRTYDEAKQDFLGSLERLQVQSVDHIQMHGLVEQDEWDLAMGPGGALEYLIEARDQGLTRFIGVTGHGFGAPAMHRKSLERFPFDSVLLPYNYPLMKVPEYARDFADLVDYCSKNQVAVQTIKAVARRPWPEDRTRTTWYEPLEDQGDIDLAASWVLANPDVFLLSAGDINILPRILDAADRGLPCPDAGSMDSLVGNRDMELIFDAP